MSVKHQSGHMPWDITGNPILVKSQLGRNKPSQYDLPTDAHLYGKNTGDDPEHANHLMYKWNYHKNSQNLNQGRHKDFKQTNKNCLHNLLHTSSQWSTYRKSNTKYQNQKEGTRNMKIKLPDQFHAYGKPGDLEDPIRLVMGNNYGQTDKTMRHTFYALQSANKTTGGAPLVKKRLSFHKTKNHHLVKEANRKRMQKFDWGHKNSEWKMSKFSEIAAKVKPNRKGQNPSISRMSQKGSENKSAQISEMQGRQNPQNNNNNHI